MRNLLLASVLSPALLCLGPFLSFAQSSAQPAAPASHPLSDAIVNRLPADYREPSKNLLVTDREQARAAQLPEEQLTAFAIAGMGRRPQASEFLVTELDKEPSATLRADIVQAVGRYWLTHPEVAESAGAACSVGSKRRCFAQGPAGAQAHPAV